MVYQFRTGAHVPAKADPTLVGQRLDRITKRKGTRLTAKTLTDEAEAHPNDPILSPWFEWDSELAVRKYHEQQALSLIGSVMAIDLTPEQSVPVRAFVLTSDNGERHFVSISVVIKEPDRRKELIAQVEREKKSFDDKLSELIALIKLL